MCDYTQIEFQCGHVRYTVRVWCTTYETTHRRCPLSIVAIEFRYVLFAKHLCLAPNNRSLGWMNDVGIVAYNQSNLG
jgi:hypothetical protein